MSRDDKELTIVKLFKSFYTAQMTNLRFKHGHTTRAVGTKTSEYNSWQQAKARCSNTNLKCYPSYGGRGIKMCEEWQMSFAKFFEHMGPKPPGTSLDRINNDGNYEPGNCRWATRKEQIANRRARSCFKLRGRYQE